ncbi:MAG: hypothetical protein ACNJA3_27890 (plasmid) [Pseudomonas rhizophila]|uniref:hypothetical protein n=1 Tax=Pseudomonas rhizophila TaxID=2045200 RepID=UPI003F6BA3B9
MQLTDEFHKAMKAEKAAFRALDHHWRCNPAKWKFWKRPPSEWKQLEAKLIEDYKQACLALSKLKDLQTPGREISRYKAIKLGGISATIFFAAALGLAGNHFFNGGLANWLAVIIAVIAAASAVVTLMSAFVIAE